MKSSIYAVLAVSVSALTAPIISFAQQSGP
ncbi:MAG: hypothetical protein QOF74_4444, partial [Caballeronia mineralivorans]|nr:hypothetical protein [Caballeronia mineralivorans]